MPVLSLRPTPPALVSQCDFCSPNCSRYVKQRCFNLSSVSKSNRYPVGSFTPSQEMLFLFVKYSDTSASSWIIMPLKVDVLTAHNLAGLRYVLIKTYHPSEWNDNIQDMCGSCCYNSVPSNDQARLYKCSMVHLMACLRPFFYGNVAKTIINIHKPSSISAEIDCLNHSQMAGL